MSKKKVFLFCLMIALSFTACSLQTTTETTVSSGLSQLSEGVPGSDEVGATVSSKTSTKIELPDLVDAIEVDGDKNDQELLDEAREEAEPEQCEQVTDGNLQIQCFNQVYLDKALADQDTRWCAKLTPQIVQDRCLDELKEILAKENLDLSACATISSVERRSLCETDIMLRQALSAQNITLCNGISDQYSEVRKRCQEKIRDGKNKEIFAKATQQNFYASLCKNLVNKNERETCSDLANYKAAIKEKDASKCADIFNVAQKQQCFVAVILPLANERQNPELCLGIPDQSMAQKCRQNVQAIVDRDLFRGVRSGGDKAECLKIKNNQLRTACQDLL